MPQIHNSFLHLGLIATGEPYQHSWHKCEVRNAIHQVRLPWIMLEDQIKCGDICSLHLFAKTMEPAEFGPKSKAPHRYGQDRWETGRYQYNSMIVFSSAPYVSPLVWGWLLTASWEEQRGGRPKPTRTWTCSANTLVCQQDQTSIWCTPHCVLVCSLASSSTPSKNPYKKSF